ncbi:hypothetical protein BCR43DRAFT_483741 [Syncephalastrum racemosum]|uniref:Myb-like domain-containing protein n=1 Tax=Syncephalastrum racemosum TaxID=13706 RepID=A0A1X2HVT7_SYNRA|nr:hypothetical protein BCR43DRAFT_483741 [Syncephalastrum racemosum]
MPGEHSTQESTPSNGPKTQGTQYNDPDDLQFEDVLEQFEDAPEQSDDDFQDAQDDVGGNANANSNSDDEYEDAADVANQDNGELGDESSPASPSLANHTHAKELGKNQEQESSSSLRLEDTQEEEESMAVFRTSSKEHIYHMSETQEFSILIDDEGNIQDTPPAHETQSSVLNLTDDEEEHRRRSTNGADSSNSSMDTDNGYRNGTPHISQTKRRWTRSHPVNQEELHEDEDGDKDDEQMEEAQNLDDAEHVQEEEAQDEETAEPYEASEAPSEEPEAQQESPPPPPQRRRKRKLPDNAQRPESQPKSKEKKEREPNRFWTNDEIAALEEGLSKVKGPMWERIKKAVYPRLESRNGVQVKDKARNEIKYRKLNNEDLGPYAYVDKETQPNLPQRRRRVNR